MVKKTLQTKEQIKEQVIEAMNFRHATKVYDDTRKIADEDFQYILEAGRLSPSSLGSEPWKFLVIQDSTLREKMMDVCPGAVEKLKTASHFVVIVSRTNMRYDSAYLRNHMENVQFYPANMIDTITEQYKHFQKGCNILDSDRSLNDWAAKQTYIALGNMITAAAMIGVDSSPMEGFRPQELDVILDEEGLLENGAYASSVLVAFGYRKEDPKRDKTRRPIKDVVTWV